MDNQAVPTNSPLQTYKKLLPKEVQKEDKVDLAYYDMAIGDGWKNLKPVIEGWIAELDDNLNITNEDSVENIGFKYMATGVAKAYLRKVIGMVEGSYEYIREREQGK